MWCRYPRGHHVISQQQLRKLPGGRFVHAESAAGPQEHALMTCAINLDHSRFRLCRSLQHRPEIVAFASENGLTWSREYGSARQAVGGGSKMTYEMPTDDRCPRTKGHRDEQVVIIIRNRTDARVLDDGDPNRAISSRRLSDPYRRANGSRSSPSLEPLMASNWRGRRQTRGGPSAKQLEAQVGSRRNMAAR
jgi:hypothetical protein